MTLSSKGFLFFGRLRERFGSDHCQFGQLSGENIGEEGPECTIHVDTAARQFGTDAGQQAPLLSHIARRHSSRLMWCCSCALEEGSGGWRRDDLRRSSSLSLESASRRSRKRRS